MKKLPTFHDWYLAGIESDYDDTIILKLFFENEARILKLSGVEDCLFNDFRQGNIVAAVKVLDPSAPEEQFMKKTLLPEIYYMDTQKPFFTNTLERIRKGELLCIHMTTSYGCYGTILCKGYEEEVWDRTGN